MQNIVILSASNNFNLKLSEKIANEINKHDAQSKVINLVDLNLPLYTPEKEKEGIPNLILEQMPMLEETTKFVFVAPEYNGGVPPTLTNYIAWISVATKDFRKCFNEKKALIATHSGGGGLHVLMILRVQLAYIGMNVIGRQLHTHYQKELNEESLSNTVKQLLQ